MLRTTLITLAALVAISAGPLRVGQGIMAEEQPVREKVTRVGVIGLDTSHAVHFTRIINDPAAEGDLAALRVVAGYPGGSPDIPSSRDRVVKFTEDLRGMGVEIVDSIPELLEKVDVVLLESVDGRPHLEQVRPVFEAKKLVFIDKPLAGSLADAVAIHELGKRHGVAWFSSSSLRFDPGTVALRGGNEEIGEVVGCATWAPCSLEPHHPDLFWYGVHGVEALFTVMGRGCKSVVRVQKEDTDQVTGVWEDGRIGTFRGMRSGKRIYGGMVFGTRAVAPAGRYSGYEPLLVEVAKFFRTGKPPVDPEETLEIFAFMEAADESKRRGGSPVLLETVLERAREEARRKLSEGSGSQ